MSDRTVLVANRGEIAVRVMRAAADLGLRTCAVYSADDAESGHVRQADLARPLPGRGASAYLDGEQVLAVATAAFGRGELYVEQLVPRARHVEVQVLGDGAGAVTHLWERECSIQRRNQKLIEIAPAPGLPAKTRDRLIEAALVLAEAAGYSG